MGDDFDPKNEMTMDLTERDIRQLNEMTMDLTERDIRQLGSRSQLESFMRGE